MDFLQNILDYTIFKGENAKLHVSNILIFLGILIAFVFIFRFCFKRALPIFFRLYEVSQTTRSKIKKNALIILLLSFAICTIWSLDFNIELYKTDYFVVKLSNIFQALWVIKLAQILDILITRIRNKNLKMTTEPEVGSGYDSDRNKVHIIQWLVYLVVGLILVNFFEADKALLNIKGFSLKISSVLIFFIVLVGSRLFAWFLTQIVFQHFYKKNKIEKGAQHSVNQLLSYVIYVMAFFVAMNLIDVQMNLVLGGAAALLVGVGLGLQQTFNDFFSGIILLFERSIGIGDIVNVDGVVGRVKRIDIRTSKIETRDNLTVIVPNSKLVTENVINWSHENKLARFEIKIGASFKTDSQLVKHILLEIAESNPHIEQTPPPNVRFIAFGDYALEFHLLFWSKELLNIEDVKSDMRFEINEKFQESGIDIPYPVQSVIIQSAHQSKDLLNGQ